MGAARTRLKTYALGAAAVAALLSSTACEPGGSTDDAATSGMPSSSSSGTPSASASGTPGTATPDNDNDNDNNDDDNAAWRVLRRGSPALHRLRRLRRHEGLPARRGPASAPHGDEHQ